jgi:hypothetical protein
MDEQEMQEMARRAAVEAVALFAAEHPCRLTDSERGIVHSLHEALSEEGGNHGTLRVIVQVGKSFQDITKTARRTGLLILLVIILLFGMKIGPEMFRFWGR